MEWQPIETVPKDGTPVDLWVPGLPHPDFPQAINECPPQREADCWYRNGEWVNGMGGYPLLQAATHWMPLPTPPKPE